MIAHSFGTYIIAEYINSFAPEDNPVSFNSIILTGSIINPGFDWELQRECKVARVLNEIAPNDGIVKFMPNMKAKKFFGLDDLFGNSGVKGFKKNSDILTQTSNDVFTHNNVIKRDIIEKKWMPFLNANRYAKGEEYFRYVGMKMAKNLEEIAL